MIDPLAAILTQAGLQTTFALDRDDTSHAQTIVAALIRIGALADRMNVAQQCVANALFKYSIRLPGAGERVSPDEVHKALDSITQGLRKIDEGLNTIAFARQTAGAGSLERVEHLANIHQLVIGAIADALPISFGVTSQQILDSVPEYSHMGFKDEWRGSFALAADRVQSGSEAWSNADLALPKSPTEVARDELIADLAKIIWEVTGKRPKAPDRAGNLRPDWKSKFPKFVADLWVLTGEIDAPSAKVIRGVLKNLTPLDPGGEG